MNLSMSLNKRHPLNEFEMSNLKLAVSINQIMLAADYSSFCVVIQSYDSAMIQFEFNALATIRNFKCFRFQISDDSVLMRSLGCFEVSETLVALVRNLRAIPRGSRKSCRFIA